MSFLISSEAVKAFSKSSLMSFTSEFMLRWSVTVVHESSIAWALPASIVSRRWTFSISRSAERLWLNAALFTLYSASAAL